VTKDVLISINGLQLGDDDQNEVEVITPGEYYNKNGKHFLLYDEVSQDYPGVTKNTIKINKDTVEIKKKGYTNVHMVFKENTKNMTYYHTPFGNMLVGLCASNIDITEKPGTIDVNIDYSLEINDEHISNCKVNLKIKPQKEGMRLM